MATKSQSYESDVSNSHLKSPIVIPPMQESTARNENREHTHAITDQQITVNISTTELSIVSEMQIKPTSEYYSSNSTVQVIEDQPAPVVVTASIESDTGQDIEMTSELSTLNGPSGLLIGEKTPVAKPAKLSSPLQSNETAANVSTIESVMTSTMAASHNQSQLQFRSMKALHHAVI